MLPHLPDMHGCDAVGIERGYLPRTLATPFENGMVQTRAAFPRVRRSFKVPFLYVSEADRSALDDFVRSVVLGDAGIWIWTDPMTEEEIHVRFVKDRVPQPVEAGYVFGAMTYKFTLEFEEV